MFYCHYAIGMLAFCVFVLFRFVKNIIMFYVIFKFVKSIGMFYVFFRLVKNISMFNVLFRLVKNICTFYVLFRFASNISMFYALFRFTSNNIDVLAVISVAHMFELEDLVEMVCNSVNDEAFLNIAVERRINDYRIDVITRLFLDSNLLSGKIIFMNISFRQLPTVR